MTSKLEIQNPLKLSDWQLFTNNGNFNNPVPPSRRLKKRYSYFALEIDSNYVRSRCQTAKSRNQSAISRSTRRVLSARSVNYRRPPRVKPIEFDLDEEADVLSSTYRSPRVLTAASQRSKLSTPQAWSFSHLHRAIISIDEQAKKDYEVGRTMNALAAWQNALVFCDELTQRNQLWPESKAALDEEIAALRNTYKHHIEETMRKNKHIQQGQIFIVPKRKCTTCQTDQLVDQFHQRFSTICQHVERTVCNKCIDNLTKNLSKTSNETEVNCPEPHCKAKLNLKHVCQLLGTGTHTTTTANVHHQSKSHSIERKTEFIHCAHEGCGSGQFHISNPNISPIVTCILCKRQTCALHHVKWHKGMTCAQYDQQQLVLTTTKTCPKCQNDMTRDPNNNSITCHRCSLEYCWECLADFRKIQRKGPQHHTTTCPYYIHTSKQKTSKSSACNIL